VLLVSLVAILGPGLWSTTLVLGILLAPGTARVVRSAVLAMREQPYVEAARCAGAGHARIVRSCVLPNVSAAILVLATTQLGAAVLAESTLSFLGYGVPPPFPTWGAMLSGTGRAFMLQSPWLSIWPGLAISAAVFGFNMLGDALRDIFDPRLRGR
jgi:peptide/nickel transport system permease protein